MKKIFTLVLVFWVFYASSQTKNIIGIIRDSITLTPVEFASITNMSSQKTVIANVNGVFTMNVSENNLLSIASVNYYIDTFFINNKNWNNDTFFIYLHPITKKLQDVTVTGIINRYQNDSTIRRKQFLENVGGNKIPTVATANSGAGIGLNIDRFSKREKQKRKAYLLFEKLEEEYYINYRFSVQLVKKYTALKGEQLTQFMNQFRPNYQWLRNNTTEEDLKYYLNEKLKIFFERNKN